MGILLRKCEVPALRGGAAPELTGIQDADFLRMASSAVPLAFLQKAG
jgi:hypothetical protein